MACAHNWYSGICLNCGIGPVELVAENARLTAELDAWKANAEALDRLLEDAVGYYPMGSRSDVEWVSRKKKVRAAHAKLKGEV